ncbi:MAG: hypothetical protein U1E26_09735 [Coriobacteriia bacterium]|nr:hypothetical protein [Coriobacteriia bacterium]
MLGIGAAEFGIIVLIALVLFGAPILTFIVGYSLGKKNVSSDSGGEGERSQSAPPEQPIIDSEEPADG